MRKLLNTIFPVRYRKLAVEIKNIYLGRFSQKSYSQEGEDMILRRIFERQSKGFYIDIGAHHPFRYSNTYYFYIKGWNGINIDPLPGCMEKFDIFRSRDLNLELPISNTMKELTYYILNDSALNGFSKQLTEERIAKGNYHLIETKKLKTQTLKEIFEIYLKQAPLIDFMSIDVEGHENEVVLSNDWSIYRPKIVLVEILNKSLDELRNDRTVQFLNKYGYHFIAKTIGTCFFITEEYFNDRFDRNVMKI